MKSRIMYVERKAESLSGTARISRMTFSKSGKTLSRGGQKFRSLKGSGFKANYYDVDSGDHYWISGCKKDGSDRLYGERIPIRIDEEAREEYWLEIRQAPHRKEEKLA